MNKAERREKLLAKLRALHPDVFGRDAEVAHARADDALIAYLNDPEITAAYEAIEKWYA